MTLGYYRGKVVIELQLQLEGIIVIGYNSLLGIFGCLLGEHGCCYKLVKQLAMPIKRSIVRGEDYVLN